MNKLEKISNLINLRDYLSETVNNLYIKLDREQLKNVQNRISLLDRIILDEGLSMDLTDVFEEDKLSAETFVPPKQSKGKKKEADA